MERSQRNVFVTRNVEAQLVLKEGYTLSIFDPVLLRPVTIQVKRLVEQKKLVLETRWQKPRKVLELSKATALP